MPAQPIKELEPLMAEIRSRPVHLGKAFKAFYTLFYTILLCLYKLLDFLRFFIGEILRMFTDGELL